MLVIDVTFSNNASIYYNIQKHISKDTILLQESEFRISDCPENCLILTDSDERIAFYSQYNLPIIAWSHPNNQDQDLMGTPWLILSPDAVDDDFLHLIFCRHYKQPLTIQITARCQIRELMPEDLHSLILLDNEHPDCEDACFFPASIRLSDSLPLAETFLIDYITHQYPFYNYGIYAVLDKITLDFLGIAGFSTPDEEKKAADSLEICYSFYRNAQGKGLAKESVSALISYGTETLGYSNITARIHAKNTASIHFAEICHIPYDVF